MATTYSTSLKLALIGDGDQSGIWGQTTNTNLGTLLEQAITGVQSITMIDANYTLTSFNGTLDEARNAVLVVTGTNSAVRDLIPPLVEKLYTIQNNTTGGYAIRVIGSSGTGVNIPNGTACLVYCDGTNFYSGLSGTSGNFTVNGNVTAVNLSTTSNVTATSFLLGNNATITNTLTSANVSATSLFATTSNATTFNGTTANVTTVNATTVNSTNVNTSNVTITGGTITGLASALPVASGGTGLTSPGTSGNVLTSNGTAWVSSAVVNGIQAQTFTSNGTFTIPAGITALKATVVGGGGGGGSNGGNFTSGGGAGGTGIAYLTGLTPGSTIAVTVGTGGAADTAGTFSRIASGTQSITTVTANGGGAGGGNVNQPGGAGGTSTGGTINIGGGGGGASDNGAGLGGNSIFGGGGRNSWTPGASPGTGNAPGAGGGGAWNTSGGAGANGIVIFEY